MINYLFHFCILCHHITQQGKIEVAKAFNDMVNVEDKSGIETSAMALLRAKRVKNLRDLNAAVRRDVFHTGQNELFSTYGSDGARWVYTRIVFFKLTFLSFCSVVTRDFCHSWFQFAYRFHSHSQMETFMMSRQQRKFYMNKDITDVTHWVEKLAVGEAREDFGSVLTKEDVKSKYTIPWWTKGGASEPGTLLRKQYLINLYQDNFDKAVNKICSTMVLIDASKGEFTFLDSMPVWDSKYFRDTLERCAMIKVANIVVAVENLGTRIPLVRNGCVGAGCSGVIFNQKYQRFCNGFCVLNRTLKAGDFPAVFRISMPVFKVPKNVLQKVIFLASNKSKIWLEPPGICGTFGPISGQGNSRTESRHARHPEAE